MYYFEKPGKENTAKTAELAIAAAKEAGIQTIVAASGSGYTAKFFEQAAKEGMKIVIVTRVNGFKEPGRQDFPEDLRRQLEQEGMQVITTAHALSGAERGLSNRFGGVYPVEIIAHTLRMLGQGTKVCVECAVMALDCGAIQPGPVVCVGGTGSGADTAWILRPAHAQNILDVKLDRLICKVGPQARAGI